MNVSSMPQWARCKALLGLPTWVGAASLRVEDRPGAPPGWSKSDAYRLTRGMAPRRRADFLTGRHCAALALKQAGLRLPGVLARAADGQPDWPPGWLGSISHSGDHALALAAPTHRAGALGVDLQYCMTAAAAEEVATLIACPDELALLSRHLTRPLGLSLLLSAKETLYKAAFPAMRTFQDFDAARLVALTSDTVWLMLTRDWLPPDWARHKRVPIRYCCVDDGVATALCATRPTPTFNR